MKNRIKFLTVIVLFLGIFGGGFERIQKAQNISIDERSIKASALVPTVLTPGDIAIVGRITNGAPDSFSFVNFVTLGSGTIIYFTDNGWTGMGFRGITAGDANGSEDLTRFTANVDIPPGTLIRSTDVSANFAWTTSGAIGAGGNYAALAQSGSGDQISAVQSTNLTNPLFSGFTTIYQLDNTKFFENAIDANSNNTAAGISTAADTAFVMGDLSSYAAFNLTSLQSGSKADWLDAINNRANWTFSNLATLPNTNITVGAGASAPSIRNTTLSGRFNLPTAGGGSYSAVIGDAGDGGALLGINFTIADPDTPVGNLVVTATSSNAAVVPNGNLNLTGAGATRNLKITPAAAGYSTITVTVSDGATTASYVINYAASLPANNTANTVWHTGKADASTAVVVDANYMFVADDEDQFIRLYDRDDSAYFLNAFNFTDSLGLTDISDGDFREVDIEASARVGNRIYWLASHSNSSTGAIRLNRSRLFATDVAGAGAATTLAYVGRYDGLKTDLINWDVTNAHGLGANFFGLQASAAVGVIPEAPDGSGFNIEGLVFAPDNTTAYVSFRAPISPAAGRTNALIVPVTNFASLVTGNPSAGPAIFGAPIQLNLGGRGIREIKKTTLNEYLIVAGTAGGAANFATYSWTGNAGDTPILRSSTLNGLNPECIVDVPAGLNAFAPNAAVIVQIISDNGDDVNYGDGLAAKDLLNNEHKKFRSDLVNILAQPVAANVNVGGRVSTAEGMGIGRARITLTNTISSERRTVLSNPFGYFNFEEIEVGITYIIEVTSKRYTFATQVITPNESVEDLNFQPL